MSKGRAEYRRLAEEQLDEARRILNRVPAPLEGAEMRIRIAAVYAELAKSDPVEAVRSM